VPVALRTPRLLLREWREDDREPFAAIGADPQVMQYLPALPDRAASDAWIDRMRAANEERGFAYWVVELPDEASLIGAIGLSRVRAGRFPFAPATECGWRLARRYWGKGYASEAARAAIEDGLGRLGFDEIVAFAVAGNKRSWQVMERLGMTHDPADDFDHPALPEGHPHRRHVLYRIRR
jgi:RimJ/RimL family protein N-acetyltransferase